MLLGNPLLNDDRNLNTQPGLELSGPAVGLGNPLMNDNGTSGSPMAGLQAPAGLQDMTQFQQGINSVFTRPTPVQPMPRQAQIFYSPSTGNIVVNGSEPFSEQNASMALASEEWANQPPRRFTLPDTASDWREMSREEYAAYIDGIRNPSFNRRMGEAWQHAWRGMGDIALGASLAVNPEWEWAQTARDNLRQEFINDAPFLLRLQDVDNVQDGLTYAAQMAVQGVPWLVETLASMGVGAILGGAVSGGAGAPAGAVEGFLANQAIREATKRSIANALRQNLARGARAYQQAAAARTVTQQAATALTREEVAQFAVQRGIASADDVNRFFTFGERAYHMARGGQTGAMATMFGSNYATGVGDIRNSIEDAGGDPQSADAIANIWGLALPYAMIESLGDVIITQPLTHIGPDLFNATARSARIGDQIAARATNAARGFGIVGAAEGVEEGAQYGITQQGVAGATGRPLDIEPMDLLENVAGGFFAGGALGGGTYAFRRPNVRLEDGGLTAEPTPDTPDAPSPPTLSDVPMPWEYGSEGTPNLPGPVADPDAPSPPTLSDVPMPWEYGNSGTPGLMVPPDPYDVSGRPVEQGPTAQEEREFLLRTLEDPNLTPEQYAATVQAIDALEGGRDSNMDAGDRYRAGANRGVLPDYGPMPEYQEPAPTDFGPAYEREVDPEALNSSMMEPGTAVSPDAIFQDMMDGKPVTPQQIEVVRSAVRELQRQNPTNPVYSEVIDAINRVEAEQSMDEYTNPDSEAFKARFPELTNYMETKPEGFKQSPMDAARPASRAQPAKAKPAAQVELGDDGLPKYGKHRLKTEEGRAELTRMLAEKQAREANWGVKGDDDLRGRTEEPAAQPKAEPDLIEQARKLGKKEKNRTKQREKRQKKAALKKAEKAAEREAKMREMAERTEPEAKPRPFGRDSQRAFDRYEAERRANEEATRGPGIPEEPNLFDVLVKNSDHSNKELYPPPPKNEKITGQKVVAISKEGTIEEARFVIKDETLEVEWAEGGKIEMKAGTYYVYNGVPVRADVYENTREPVEGSFYGKSGKFRVKAGVKFDGVIADKDGVVKTLEQPTNGQSYKAGDVILTGSIGEQWPQSMAKAEKKYTISNATNRIKEAAARAKAEAEAKPEPKKRTQESDELREAASIKAEPKTEKEQSTRADTAYKQGMRKYKDLFSLLQGARGKLGRSKKNSYEGKRDLPLPFTTTTKWIVVDDVALSYNELEALIERVRAEYTATERTERSATVFHDYVKDMWMDIVAGLGREANTPNTNENKRAIEQFTPFVEKNAVEIANWLGSEVSKLLPPARNAAQKILSNLNDTKRAGIIPKGTVLNPNGRPKGGVVSDILRKVLADNPDFTFRPVHHADRKKAERVIDDIHDAQRTAGVPESTVEQLQRHLGNLRKETRPKQSGWVADIDLPGFKPLKKSIAQETVKGVQQRIFKDFRFRSVHVLSDEKDFWDKVETIKMTAENGAEYTMAQHLRRMAIVLKLERPEYAVLSDTQAAYQYYREYMHSRAFVVGGFDALIVFSGHMQTKRELLEVLEHEYIVHKGLSAIFKDNEERTAFLARLMSIPGMKEKRDALLARAPAYRVATPLAQVEEVLAFSAMEGPLVLEALLSAPQTFDPATKMTLWDEFKRIVMDWINRVFGGFRTSEDEALHAITMALRDYAMTGRSPDLHAVIEGKATLSKADVEAIMVDIDGKLSDSTRRAIASATPAETYEKLHGEGDNVGRPYSRREWQNDVMDEATSDKSLMAKLDEIARGKVATPIKERLKAIARELVTMNQMAMESPLIEKMMEIMDNTIKRARFLMGTWTDARPHAHRDFLTTELTKIWGDKAPGATDEQRSTYGRMAIAATNHLLSKLTDEIVRQSPRLLVRHPNGTYDINYEVFNKLLEQGTLSKEAFINGLQQYTVDSEGDVTEASVAKFTKEEVESAYEIYLIETRLMAESALVTLEDATVMLSQKNNRAVKRLIEDNKFKPEDQAFVNEALQRMYKLYTDIAFHDYGNKTIREKVAQADRARQVLAELMRTFHEKKKVADWTDSRITRDDTAKSPRKNDAFKWREQADPHEDVKPFVNQIRWFLEYDSTFGDSRLARINSLGVTDNRQYHMLSVFQNLLNSEVIAHEKENKVIQSILGNYVEMTRKGKWRVSFEVYEEDGKTPADISPVLLAKLPAIYAESEREANAIQAELSKEFGDNTYTVNDAAGKPVQVKFDIAVAMAPGQATMTDAPDIEGFLKVGELVGLKINASMMKRITQMIANASTRKRFGLQRAGSPGMDADIIRNNSETMSQRAWEAAKTSQSHMLEDELTDPKNRYGDWDKLAQLQRKFDIANRGAPEGTAPPITFVRNPKAVLVAELELLRYANQMKHVARRTTKTPTVNIRTTKGELKLPITGEAEAYITHAKALRESLDKNQLELNLNDLLSKTGSLRQMAVVSQLGTVASGIMNAFTPITHLPARLMAIHRETGYGDGFGFSEVTTEIAAAMSQVMTVFKGYGDTVMLKEILDEARKGNNETNLTLPELEAMYAETLNGVLTPQQTYSLTGGTESNLRSVLYRNISNVLLKPFSSVEAGTRRVAFLASYRLLKQRFIAAGVGTEEDFNTPGTEAYKKLIKEVERVIKDSQGDYTNVNRPRAFRGDFAQYILQYKMFPLITVLMINNLPLAQKGAVLGTLFLLAGLKGEPFADDFMDIYDTVMQKLGLQHDSLELSMVQFFEDLLPGSSKWIMHGGIDAVAFGGTMSSRLAMGDIIPLTGLFRPEADVGREVVNAFGPAFAANADALEYASILTDFTLEMMGMRPRTMAWEDLFRKFPQGQVRGIGEAIQMGVTGEISDPRGRLTSDEVGIYNIFMRALGFYPLEASKANDTVRLDRMHTGYMRNIRTRFVLAYARAYRAGDDAAMERINDAVRDWNEAAELTGQDDMLIRNFRSAAIRAGRAASQTTVERTSSSAPDYSVIDELAAATGADTEADE